MQQEYSDQAISDWAIRTQQEYRDQAISDWATRTQQEYSRDQTIISDRVQTVLRKVLVDDVANIVYEYIFSTKRIDYARDPLFDVWYKDRWVEARIVRPGTYPDFAGYLAEREEVERTSVPQFVQLEGSPSQYNVKDVMNRKFIPDRVAAYQSRILHPPSRYYSMDDLKIASDEHRLMVYDTEAGYHRAQIVKMDGDDLVWIHYHGYHSKWDECIPIQSHRFRVGIIDEHGLHGVSLRNWLIELSDSIKCYHQFQMLTLDLLISHDFDAACIRAALAQRVCELTVP
jgi:hypothetical protein